jgi:L-ascorbate metabolism protein UlaG (beta-lactamase superfamily)
VQGRRSRVYFGGDGGWSGSFGEIGRRLGPFELTLLEIGAFDPAWGEVHLGPAKAARAHGELRGRVLLPIH